MENTKDFLTKWNQNKTIHPYNGKKLEDNEISLYYNRSIKFGIINDIPDLPMNELKQILLKWKSNPSKNPINNLNIVEGSDIYFKFIKFYKICNLEVDQNIQDLIKIKSNQKSKINKIVSEIRNFKISPSNIELYIKENYPEMLKYKNKIVDSL